jgi:hypothetical protein
MLDPSGAVLTGVIVHLAKAGSGEGKSATTDEDGAFRFLLLPPGKYELRASAKDFEPVSLPEITIHVTETLGLELNLRLATRFEHAQVTSDLRMAQLDSSTLGRVVNDDAVSALPLVSRNFAQIASLSTGVSTGVYNAGELGLGGTAQSQIAKSNDGIYVHGARSYDNNFQLDGISISDVQGSASGSGGIPIPSPDGIQEFKVQTGLYDAAYGRYGGANITLITKMGGNDFHGTVFEYLRNKVLNANDFFLNRADQPRPVLTQNQFGFAFGGPIKKEKVIFFGSYQGTRQVNGIAAGQSRTACTATLTEPPLTNDRTPAELGKMFGGATGVQGGTAIKPDGSNINPVALALLNFKLPDGTFLIPTPQTVDPARPLVQQGFSVLTDPCHFSENQLLTNVDYLARPNSKIAARFFLSDEDETVTFPGNGVNPAGNIRGFSSPSDSGFRVFSLAHTYSFRNAWINEGRIGYVRTRTSTEAQTPFNWSDIGVAEGEMSHNNELPSLNILGSASIASGFPRTITQNSFVFSDSLSFVRSAHTVRLGGSLTRLQDNVNLVGLGSFMQFLSWPDFLLGLSASDNGTGFSNVFASFDDFGLTTREYRAWEGAAFAQDDYKIRKRLTLNLGLRYERLGQFGDRLGRNASFDISRANPNPPASGSVAGYAVASNFRGVVPAGVIRTNNTFGNDGEGQNTIAPRCWNKHYRLANWGCLAIIAEHRSVRAERGVRRVLFPTHRPGFLSKHARRPVLPFSVECWKGERERLISIALSAAFSYTRFLSSVSFVLSYDCHDYLLGCTGFPTCHDPTVFVECSGRGARRLVVGGWIRGHARNALGTSTFAESGPVGLQGRSHQGSDRQYCRKYSIASPHPGCASRLSGADGIRRQFLVQRAGGEHDEAAKP